ncbi:MAG: hypothetical protein ABSH41_30440, partial [Syntrophobacteraceae bacterium]
MPAIMWKHPEHGGNTWIGVQLTSGEIVCRPCLTDKENEADDKLAWDPVILVTTNLICGRCKRKMVQPNPLTGELDHL